MRARFALLFSILLAACATTPPPVANMSLFGDALFAPPSERIDAEDIFALTPEMKEFVHTRVAHETRHVGSSKALYYALYPKGDLRIDYDASTTRNARQTFEAKSGNCLSLAIMTAALARELNLKVQYQHVLVDETWSRQGNLFFSSGHVNLVLGKKHKIYQPTSDPSDTIVIDFLPHGDAAQLPAQFIDEKTIIAMYMNNRAAESMATNHSDDAYWWARNAVLQDPSFTITYNTLGVVYLHHGDPELARRVFSYTLEREPSNTVALFNLIQVLKNLGRTVEADAMTARLQALQPEQPYHFFNLGREAMQRGDFKTARDLFLKEVDRDPYNHEFQFWLASAYFRLGEMQKAGKHLKLAMEYNPTRSGRELYAAKLDRLKAYLTN
jgi:tetratricopeptide (TPR) repeat protein